MRRPRRTTSLAGALLIATLAGTLALAQQVAQQYDIVKRQIKSGKTEDSDLQMINDWIKQNKHGARLRIARGEEVLCLHQLKVMWLYNKYLRAGAQGGDWMQELRKAVEASRADKSECNGLIGENDLAGMWKAFDDRWTQYEQETRGQRIAALGKECQTIKTTHARRLPLADLSCDVGGDPQRFETDLVARARQIGSQLQGLWQKHGERALGGEVPQPGPGASPVDAFAALAAWIDQTATARRELWSRKLEERTSALGALPAEERAGFGAAPDPGDVGEWGFWDRLDKLVQQTETIAASGKGFAERKKSLLAQYRFAPEQQEACRSLERLCESPWVGRTCQGGAAPGALLETCREARLDQPEAASLAALDRAVRAVAGVGDAQRWREAAGAFQSLVAEAARRARKSCEKQANLLSAMDAAVGQLQSASLRDGQPFAQAMRAVQQCEQGSAFDYRQLATAMAAVETLGGDCVATLPRERQRIESVAKAIAGNAQAANEGALTAGRDAMAGSMACIEQIWRRSHEQNRAAVEQERKVVERAGTVVAAVQDPRYEALKARIKNAAPASATGEFQCAVDGRSAADAVRAGLDPVQVAEQFKGCAPAAGGPGANGCRLLLVSALAGIGTDLAAARWDAAAGKLRPVADECRESLVVKDREVLDYFNAYLASKTGHDSGIARNGPLRPLGYDPRFDDTLEAKGAQR